MHDERVVNEMVLILLAVAELRDDGACALALSAAGFRASAIYQHLDEARALAEEIRSGAVQ